MSRYVIVPEEATEEMQEDACVARDAARDVIKARYAERGRPYGECCAHWNREYWTASLAARPAIPEAVVEGLAIVMLKSRGIAMCELPADAIWLSYPKEQAMEEARAVIAFFGGKVEDEG